MTDLHYYIFCCKILSKLSDYKKIVVGQKVMLYDQGGSCKKCSVKDKFWKVGDSLCRKALLFCLLIKDEV